MKSWLDKYQDGGDPIKKIKDSEDVEGGQLEEVVVHGKSRYPYYNNLTSEEKRLWNDKSPIGRSIRSKATDGVGFNAEKAKTFAKGLLVDVPLASLQVGQSAMVEGIEALKGNKYNFNDSLQFDKQRVPSDTFLKDSHPALQFAGDMLLDPELVGSIATGLYKGIRQAPKMLKSIPFTENPNNFYRGIGEEGYNDLINSKTLNSKNKDSFPNPFFVQGQVPGAYSNGYMVELANEAMTFKDYTPVFNKGDIQSSISVPKNQIHLDNPNLKIWKMNRGEWKQVSKQNNNNINSLVEQDTYGVGNDIPEWMVAREKTNRLNEAIAAAEMVKKDLADPETIRRAVELGIDPDKLEMFTKNLDINTSSNYGSHLAGTEMNINPRQINDPNLGTISGNEIGAHETGHIFQNQDLWNINYPKTLDPRDARILHDFKSYDVEGYNKIKGYYDKYSTRTSAPTKVDELLGGLTSRDPNTFPSTGETALDYFKNASDKYGTITDNMIERLPMFREYRQGMRDSGVLKNKWDEITPENMMEYHKLNPNNRLNSFIEPTVNNANLIRELSKIAPVIGAGTVLTNTQAQEQFKDGGWLSKYQDGREITKNQKYHARNSRLGKGMKNTYPLENGDVSSHLMGDKDNIVKALNTVADNSTTSARNIARDGIVVKDNNGYWNPDNQGKVVEIDSTDITMQGVDQDLIGVSDTGDIQYMEPGKDYKFKGSKVREFPANKKIINNKKNLQSAEWLDKY